MARVLLGWELGGGLGHVKSLLTVGRALAQRGHEPVFALRNLAEPAPLFRNDPFTVLQAPTWRPRPWHGKQPFLAATFADILAVRGFDRVDDLYTMVRAWQGLIDLARPDLVICDHSPTLSLTTFGAVPTVMLGNGFTMPPVDRPTFPSLVPNAQPIMGQAELLAIVQDVQRRRGRRVPDSLPQIVAGDARFIRTFPEFDPYQTVRTEPLAGPLGPLPKVEPFPATRRIFAYLSTECRVLAKVLTALAAVGFPCTVYVRDATEPVVTFAREKGLDVLTVPASLPEVLPHVSAVVHEASLGMAEASLAAGRPQVVIPPHVEKQITARALHTIGVCPELPAKLSMAALTEAITAAVGNPRYATNALAWGRQIQARGVQHTVERVVEACERLISGASADTTGTGSPTATATDRT